MSSPANPDILLGLAVGDALGAPYEFRKPGQGLPQSAAELEMNGGGPWEPGEWTDNTAMALCLAESILATRADKQLFSEDDLVSRYVEWAAGKPKDIGITCRTVLKGATSAAVARRRAYDLHQRTGKTAGNGTVMRCAPIAVAAADEQQALRAARADATLTHFDTAAAWASAALVAALRHPQQMLTTAMRQVEGDARLAAALSLVAARDEEGLRKLAADADGTAWATLAVGLWAAEVIDDYADGVAFAISLGGDAGTNAAVAGALLGARHGAEAIPGRWLEGLRERERIERLAAAITP